MGLFSRTPVSVTAETALPGRNIPLVVPDTHYVNRTSFIAPFPDGLEVAYFGMGCFWGAERRFWELGRRIHYGGWIRGWLHREPYLRGSVQRPHGTLRNGAGCIRP